MTPSQIHAQVRQLHQDLRANPPGNADRDDVHALRRELENFANTAEVMFHDLDEQ